MRQHISPVKAGLFGLALSFSSFGAFAQYSNMFVFGDSLSDNGNLHAVTQDPNIPERFSNGPVAVEDLAVKLGFTLTPSFHLLPPSVTGGQYGNNYAVAGAVTQDEDGDPTTPDINLPTQVNAFLQIHGGQAPSDALYVVMIGGNDIRAARDVKLTGEKGSGKQARQMIRASVNAETTEIEKLINAGARNLLVINVPDIGAIPETDIRAATALASAETRKQQRIAKHLEKKTRVLTARYNGRLANKLERLEDKTGVEIEQYDIFEFLNNLLDNASDYGYTNTTEACVWAFSGQGMNPSCDFSSFVFFDEIHPTAITHQRAADDIYRELTED